MRVNPLVENKRLESAPSMMGYISPQMALFKLYTGSIGSTNAAQQDGILQARNGQALSCTVQNTT